MSVNLPHEVFHTKHIVTVLMAKETGNFLLILEKQPVVFAGFNIVEPVSYPEQIIPGIFQCDPFLLCNEPCLFNGFDIFQSKKDLGSPQNRMDVP